jgi:hypothetical protein
MVKHDFKKVNHTVSAIQQIVNEIIKFMKAKKEKATQSGAKDTTSSNFPMTHQSKQHQPYSPGMTPNDCLH